MYVYAVSGGLVLASSERLKGVHCMRPMGCCIEKAFSMEVAMSDDEEQRHCRIWWGKRWNEVEKVNVASKY